MRFLPSLALVLMSLPAVAQVGNPAGMEPGTPQKSAKMPTASQPNSTDRLFVLLFGIGGLSEIDLGRLGEHKAGSDAVKSFAGQMLQDHSKANNQLTGISKSMNISMADELDPEHQAIRSQLEKPSGAEFDMKYMRAQLAEHQKAVQLLEWEINSGQDAQLQQFASQILPIVMSHLRMAQSILAELPGQVAANEGSEQTEEHRGTSGGRRR